MNGVTERRNKNTPWSCEWWREKSATTAMKQLREKGIK